MILKGANVFFNGKFQKLDVKILGNTISEVAENINGEDEVCVLDKYVIPGLIDIHTHGVFGFDFCEANEDEMDIMCKFYRDNGVTSICPTGMTLDTEVLKDIFIKINKKAEKGTAGARLLGINMEGPFLSYDKKGAHDENYLSGLDIEKMEEIYKASNNFISLVDINPLLKNSKEFIERFKDRMVISLAHTSATAEKADEAFSQGASHVTHLFNAMNSLHHREPSLVGATLARDDVTAEIICDGIHLNPAVIKIVYKCLGENTILISDSMSATGMPDGVYELGGMVVTVNDGKAVLSNGTIAGSTITVLKALQNVIKFGIDIEKAVYSVTTAPAKRVNVFDKLGDIKEGKLADILVLDKDFNIEKVIFNGEIV